MGSATPIDHRLLLLGSDPEFADRLEASLRQCCAFDVRRTEACLDLIDEFVSRHTAFVMLDADAVGDRLEQLVRILTSIDHACRFLLLASESNFPRCSALASAGSTTVLLKPVLEDHAARVVFSAIGVSAF